VKIRKLLNEIIFRSVYNDQWDYLRFVIFVFTLCEKLVPIFRSQFDTFRLYLSEKREKPNQLRSQLIGTKKQTKMKNENILSNIKIC
jgi:hypothetical protein